MSALRLPPLPSIREILKLYRLTALKSLSQNFILNDNLSNKIIKKSKIIPDSHVIEVGPGPGGLTRAIIKKVPKSLTVIEKDIRFKPILEMLAESYQLAGGHMNIVYDDITKIDLSGMFSEEEQKKWTSASPNIHIIGNLPFNVSTHLIIRWLKAISERSGLWKYGRTRMTLTFQKEVAERLVAQEDEAQRCRLSIMAQTWTTPSLKFIIPGTAFLPKPDVDVGVVTFVPLQKPQTNHKFDFYERFVRHMCCFRQKHIIRCAETLFPLYCRKEFAGLMFELAETEPSIKSLQITVEEMDRLCTAYQYILKRHPELGLYDYQASHKIVPSKYTGTISVEDYIDNSITSNDKIVHITA